MAKNVEIVINGEHVKSEADFHSAVVNALHLSPCYGANLDALWDVLSTDAERPLTLIWKNSHLSKALLGEAFEKLAGVLMRVEAQDNEWGLVEAFKFKME